MSLEYEIQKLKDEIAAAGIKPEKGLGTELFHFASTLMPVVNVDLVVLNDKKQILLSWRDDPHTGIGWHIPGSCVRFKETLEEAIQRCAHKELGTSVRFAPKPFEVFQFVMNKDRNIADQRERAHFITLSYICHVPFDYVINNGSKKTRDPGYLQWFDYPPDDLFPGHDCYKKSWDKLKKLGEII